MPGSSRRDQTLSCDRRASQIALLLKLPTTRVFDRLANDCQNADGAETPLSKMNGSGIGPCLGSDLVSYKGAAETLIEIYGNGSAGVPLLQWMGLTVDSTRAAAFFVRPYPHMIRWLRSEPE